jgi:hypothetical protein
LATEANQLWKQIKPTSLPAKVPSKSKKQAVIEKKTTKTDATDSDGWRDEINDDAGTKDQGKQKAHSGRRESKTQQKKATETAGIDSDDWRDETYDDAGSDKEQKEKTGVSVPEAKPETKQETEQETKKETKLTNSDSDDEDDDYAKSGSASSAPRLYEPSQQSETKKSRRTSHDTPKSDKLVPGQMLGEMFRAPTVIPGLESDQDDSKKLIQNPIEKCL